MKTINVAATALNQTPLAWESNIVNIRAAIADSRAAGASLIQGAYSCREVIRIGLTAAALLVTAWFKWAPIDFAEACGFVTGAICVWLVTRGNIWNWPIGLANNLFFAVLFWRARLFADMGVQGVYLVLGVWGWWNWLRGGEEHSELKVTRVPRN